ncbi:MAG: DUF547 domain-containing protein [Bdellovibrio sp. CG12_big_fil_rev_8_21_14_0_65_39_13]|nr:MAG: DUF547 domain-containing protein [Bdellovibrio sp. CG22_combo_CG10-13_8_21_14_all_39_27]PIQ58552.1 MAG: DUF547 domain-containing protein [Bdellovibrio sp. CG12_big_fil_rev_8_21_14_0_65_39_13]PIR32465.1 MAG: DUF547 domain-containing protein [Bdellovibrio sp. CG11_big_fil_rev_8_21_14_0_20_39_38]
MNTHLDLALGYIFRCFIISTLFISTLFASGNTAGGGGKSSVQANDGSLSIDFKTTAIKDSKIKEFTENLNNQLNYEEFDFFLKDAVHWNTMMNATRVDYRKLNVSNFKNYTDKLLNLSKTQVDQLPLNEQKAFYINLYNSLTLLLVVRNYPIESIKELGSGFPLYQSPWKKRFFYLFGQFSSLDKVEHELVRGNPKLIDPLLHFAFNCASIGCPALLDKAFTGQNIEEQLKLATNSFLSDRSRNFFKGDTLYVSSIFKWYESDFTSDFRKINGLKDFFKRYASSLADGNQIIVNTLKSGNFRIEFLPYNWALNDKFQ